LPVNVLVTAVSTVVGYGAIKTLRAAARPVHLTAMDIYPDAVGGYWADRFVHALPAKDPRYIEFLMETIEAHKIDLVIPTIEEELDRISEQRETLLGSGAALALNSSDLIKLARDKWLMHTALIELNLPAIPSSIGDSFEDAVERLGVPLLFKPRRSWSSRGIEIVSERDRYEALREEYGDNFLVQKLVGSDDGEFTVSVFGLGDGDCVMGPALRRMLASDGATRKAWSVDIPELSSAVRGLTKQFKPIGPTNFQFRLHGGEFLLLEVNPRISSATSIRSAFGFNEAELCIEYFLDGKRPAVPEFRKGSAIRFLEDHIEYDA
jgi:carbamoyl-phosphate synthase large subunit